MANKYIFGASVRFEVEAENEDTANELVDATIKAAQSEGCVVILEDVVDITEEWTKEEGKKK